MFCTIFVHIDYSITYLCIFRSIPGDGIVLALELGWIPLRGELGPLTLDSPLTFNALVLHRRKSYFAALLQKNHIFSKGAELIHHDRSNYSYMCVLFLPPGSLTTLLALMGTENLKDRDFGNCLRDSGGLARTLAIECRREEALAIEDGEGYVQSEDLAVPVEPRPLLHSVSIIQNSMKFVGHTVNLDHWSHWSGERGIHCMWQSCSLCSSGVRSLYQSVRSCIYGGSLRLSRGVEAHRFW